LKTKRRVGSYQQLLILDAKINWAVNLRQFHRFF
jgi:hypothetical protein